MLMRNDGDGDEQMFTRKEPYQGEKDLVALAFRIAVQGVRLTIPSSIPEPIAQLMKYSHPPLSLYL
jgi:hypothetical protein